jgi:hypothetical protein
MQQRLGIPAGLRQSPEHQLGSRLIRRALEVSHHRCVQLVTRVLLVHLGGHAFKRGVHLGLGHHTVVQPVGHVLAADAQRGAVFHQAHVVDVGHLGAAHALVHPAHHVAQNALGVVVQLGLLVGVAPVGRCDHGGMQRVDQDGVAVFARRLDSEASTCCRYCSAQNGLHNG